MHRFYVKRTSFALVFIIASILVISENFQNTKALAASSSNKKLNPIVKYDYVSDIEKNIIENETEKNIIYNIKKRPHEYFEKAKNKKEKELPIIIEGSESAQVKAVLYSSVTCTSCKNFHENIYPTIKKFIKQNKISVQFEFYIDGVGSLDALKMVYSLSKIDEKNFSKNAINIVNFIYSNQDAWLKSNNPKGYLINMMKQLGYSKKDIKYALNSGMLRSEILKRYKKFMKNIKSDSVPIFIMNGKEYQGNLSSKELCEFVERELNRKPST